MSASRGFETWTDRQRARFGRLHRRACRARIEALVASSEISAAIEAARAWVGVEPFDDEAQHRLIELLAGSGQRAEALGQYERYERLLRGEELEPLDQTRALVVLLRAGEVGNGASIPASPPQRRLAGQRIGGVRATPPLMPSDIAVGAGGGQPEWASERHRRRWPLLAAAAIVLVSVGIAGVWRLCPEAIPTRPAYCGSAPPAQRPVAVLPFEARGSKSGLEDLGILIMRRGDTLEVRAKVEPSNDCPPPRGFVLSR